MATLTETSKGPNESYSSNWARLPAPPIFTFSTGPSSTHCSATKYPVDHKVINEPPWPQSKSQEELIGGNNPLPGLSPLAATVSGHTVSKLCRAPHLLCRDLDTITPPGHYKD